MTRTHLLNREWVRSTFVRIYTADKLRASFGNRKLSARVGSRFCCASLLCLASLVGCERMVTPPGTQLVKDADAKSSQGEYLEAINLYETALDGTTRTAEIHYRLGLLYDDKLNDPLNALHHFKRYLTLDPNGTHASEIKEFMKRDEIALLTSLSGDSLITRTEAARLRNENLTLRKQIEERASRGRLPVERSESVGNGKEIQSRQTDGRTYVVKPGDTLFSISRKFYKSAARWKQIRDANKETIDSTGKLQPGQKLTIP
jgi:tetratricopeptide (TPR) repeat protein